MYYLVTFLTTFLIYISDNFFYDTIVNKNTGEIIKIKHKEFSYLLKKKYIKWNKKQNIWIMT